MISSLSKIPVASFFFLSFFLLFVALTTGILIWWTNELKWESFCCLLVRLASPSSSVHLDVMSWFDSWLPLVDLMWRSLTSDLLFWFDIYLIWVMRKKRVKKGGKNIRKDCRREEKVSREKEKQRARETSEHCVCVWEGERYRVTPTPHTVLVYYNECK